MMSNSDKNDDFAVFKNNDQPISHPAGEIDLEVSNSDEDISGTSKEDDRTLEVESATEAIIEEQYREDDVQESASVINPESEKEAPTAPRNKGNALLWCITGISLLFSAGSIYTALTAQGQAKSYLNEMTLMQNQIDDIKTRAITQSQTVEANKTAIDKLAGDQLTMFQMSEKTNSDVSALSKQIDSLNKTVDDNLNANNNALSQLKAKVSDIEDKAKEHQKKLAATKKQAVKKSSSYKRKPVVRKNKKITRKPKSHEIQTVYSVNGVSLASIDMWNHKFSATLMSSNGFRAIYPGYNVNGFIVKSIDAHTVTFITPNNKLVKLRN